MKIGAYYYPEQWPQRQWERDFDNFARMGLKIVHLAEFAWFDLEPRPGEFQFDWLDQCIEMARARGIEIILCTPTAAPPIWLSHGTPETLPMREGNMPGRFGGRRHYNPLSLEFRAATRRIVTAMAEKFGNHPSIIGWQIDNELSGSFDQSEITHRAFAHWLQNKYGDIKSLNVAWGNQFWNTYYTEFSQIKLPVNRHVIAFPPAAPGKYDNPHQHLDASRFWSWAFADFTRLQSEILKPKIGSRFVTTNFMPFHLDANPGDFARDLNLFSWDSYPVTGWETTDGDTYRIADPSAIGFVHDQMASYTGRWALMEVQPGQLNWTGVPVRVYPGAVRLWLWTAWAHGAEFLTVYRFRQPRFGVEMFHHGLMSHDGVTPTQGGEEFEEVISEMKRIDPMYAETTKEDPSNTAGIVFDFDQLWYYATLPQARRWNQPRWLAMWYAALAKFGMKIKILRPEMEWPTDLAMIVAPGLQMVDQSILDKLKGYADGGGHLVLTCRTGLMDKTGQIFEGPAGSPILELIGAKIEGYDCLRENRFGKIAFRDADFEWSIWGDQLQPDGAKVTATYADQFYRGSAAITENEVGRGKVSYFGTFSEQPLVDAFVESALKRPRLPDRLQIFHRGKYRIALNYQDKAITLANISGSKFIIGSEKLRPCDVAVWED